MHVSIYTKKNVPDCSKGYKWWVTKERTRAKKICERLTYDHAFYSQNIYSCPWNDIWRNGNFTFHYHLSSIESEIIRRRLLIFIVFDLMKTTIKFMWSISSNISWESWVSFRHIFYFFVFLRCFIFFNYFRYNAWILSVYTFRFDKNEKE